MTSSRMHARRRLSLVVLAVSAAVTVRSAEAQNVVVSNGDSLANSTSGTIGWLTVSGTGPTGNPSTYSANAPLTLSGFSIYDSGVFNVNANVTNVFNTWGFGSIQDGTLNLNSGVLTAYDLNVTGSSTINRTAGGYDLNYLSLDGGASLDYKVGDSLSGGVSVANGSRLTLDRDLASGTSGYVYLMLSGTGALERNGHSFAINDLSLSGTASLAYTAADSITDSVQVSDGGSLSLEKSLSLTSSLSLSGSGALERNGHAWAADNLYLYSGAALTYGGSDSVVSQVWITDGQFTLQKPLAVTNQLYVSGTGAVLERNGNTVSTEYLIVTNGAALTLAGSDAVGQSVYVTSGGTLTLQQNLALSSTSGYTTINVSGQGSRLITGTFGYAADSLILGNGSETEDGPSLAYRPGDSITRDLTVNPGSSFTLERNLALSHYLWLGGTNALVTGSFSYAAASLDLSYGAALAYRPGDSVTQSVSVYAPSTLTLERNLSLNGGLYLSGADTLVTGSYSYAATDLTLGYGAALTYRSGDTVTEDVVVQDGATLTLERNLSLTGALDLTGSAALSRTTQTVAAHRLNLGNGATFAYSTGDAIASSIDVVGGSLALFRPLSLAEDLLLDGAGAFAANGNSYSVRNLDLLNGATAGFGSTDSISGYLGLSGSASMLTATSPLAILSLSIGGGSQLVLQDNFTGSGGPGLWGLSLAGDQKTLLDDYLAQGRILTTYSGTAPLSVTYDAGTDKTYVTAVPEPSTLVLAGLGVAGAIAAARRRRRLAAASATPA